MVDESISIFHPLLSKFLKYMKTPNRLIIDFTTHLTLLLHFLSFLEWAYQCKKFKYSSKRNDETARDWTRIPELWEDG